MLIGRPYAYGLAIAGEAGVREVLQQLHRRLRPHARASRAAASVAEIGPEALAPAAEAVTA